MANTSYFHRFVDIVRSPMGKPLLAQLAASDRKLGELLAYPSVLPAPVPGAPETPQASVLPFTLAPGCNSKAGAGRKWKPPGSMSHALWNWVPWHVFRDIDTKGTLSAQTPHAKGAMCICA